MAIKVKVNTSINQKKLDRYFGESSKKEKKTYKTTGKVIIKRGSNKD